MISVLHFSLIVIAVMITVFVGSLLFYKKSIVIIAGVIANNMAGLTAIFTYIIASKGIDQLLWVLPALGGITIVNFYVMHRELSLPFQLLKRDIVGNMAQGNLNFEFDSRLINRRNEFGAIALAMLNMQHELKKATNHINEISREIVLSSAQQNDAALSISSSASEQASSTQEISVTVEEIASTTHQNSENAGETAGIMKTVLERMIQLEKVSSESLRSVNDIIEKIGVVNEIAYQTNILSLNASVEAARAGTEGRGFAVVANQVKMLAENSRVEAEIIHGLSELTISKNQQANEFVKTLLDEIEQTSMLIGQISSASLEQSNGTDQINNALQNLNQVAQQNAASSEELAANADELALLANKLKAGMKFFNAGKFD